MLAGVLQQRLDGGHLVCRPRATQGLQPGLAHGCVVSAQHRHQHVDLIAVDARPLHQLRPGQPPAVALGVRRPAQADGHPGQPSQRLGRLLPHSGGRVAQRADQRVDAFEPARVSQRFRRTGADLLVRRAQLLDQRLHLPDLRAGQRTRRGKTHPGMVVGLGRIAQQLRCRLVAQYAQRRGRPHAHRRHRIVGQQLPQNRGRRRGCDRGVVSDSARHHCAHGRARVGQCALQHAGRRRPANVSQGLGCTHAPGHSHRIVAGLGQHLLHKRHRHLARRAQRRPVLGGQRNDRLGHIVLRHPPALCQGRQGGSTHRLRAVTQRVDQRGLSRLARVDRQRARHAHSHGLVLVRQGRDQRRLSGLVDRLGFLNRLPQRQKPDRRRGAHFAVAVHAQPLEQRVQTLGVTCRSKPGRRRLPCAGVLVRERGPQVRDALVAHPA